MKNRDEMPRVCPVESHLLLCKRVINTPVDATALRRGGPRSQLGSSERETPRDKPVLALSDLWQSFEKYKDTKIVFTKNRVLHYAL